MANVRQKASLRTDGEVVSSRVAYKFPFSDAKESDGNEFHVTRFLVCEAVHFLT